MTYISETILNILRQGAEDTAFIIDAMLSSRPESYKKFRTSLRGRPTATSQRVDRCDIRKENQRFYSILNNLKNNGYIKKKNSGGEESWSITKTGLSKLEIFKKIAINSKTTISYKKSSSVGIIIVAFDIPERLRSCRAWLREALKYLGFSMVQQSVWVGNCKIPEQFIIDLKNRDILKCVDIFEVGNKGTLERLKF